MQCSDQCGTNIAHGSAYCSGSQGCDFSQPIMLILEICDRRPNRLPPHTDAQSLVWHAKTPLMRPLQQHWQYSAEPGALMLLPYFHHQAQSSSLTYELSTPSSGRRRSEHGVQVSVPAPARMHCSGSQWITHRLRPSYISLLTMKPSAFSSRVRSVSSSLKPHGPMFWLTVSLRGPYCIACVSWLTYIQFSMGVSSAMVLTSPK